MKSSITNYYRYDLLKGKNYNIDSEFSKIEKSVEEMKNNKMSFSDLKNPWILKPFLICVTLMLFQQLTGVNAVLFNLASIFKASKPIIHQPMEWLLVSYFVP